MGSPPPLRSPIAEKIYRTALVWQEVCRLGCLIRGERTPLGGLAMKAQQKGGEHPRREKRWGGEARPTVVCGRCEM